MADDGRKRFGFGANPAAGPARNRPRSKLLSAWVGDTAARSFSHSGPVAAAKSSTQKPRVKARVTMAAVAALSASAAAKKAMPATPKA